MPYFLQDIMSLYASNLVFDTQCSNIYNILQSQFAYCIYLFVIYLIQFVKYTAFLTAQHSNASYPL